jgi:hypothetical protein
MIAWRDAPAGFSRPKLRIARPDLFNLELNYPRGMNIA